MSCHMIPLMLRLTVNCGRCGVAFSWIQGRGGKPKHCVPCRPEVNRERSRARYKPVQPRPKTTVEPCPAVPKIHSRSCARCGAEFQWTRRGSGRSRTHCDSCRGPGPFLAAARSSARARGALLLLTCKGCSSTFERPHRPGVPLSYCEPCRSRMIKGVDGHWHSPLRLPRDCVCCKKAFMATRHRQRFCSLACRLQAYLAQRHARVCRRCGQGFMGIEHQQYCRRRCRILDQSVRLSKRGRQELRDTYLRTNLSRQMVNQLRPSEVPAAMVDTYRAVLLVKREIKRRLHQ